MKISVSILMPVYNGEAHLEDAINSILKQTYRDFELITVDDASSDGSLSILERYAKQDSRIKVITNNKNIGLTKSLIKAIDMAQGRYLARQDADDISLPERLEKQIDFLEQNLSYVAIGTSATIIDENDSVIKKALAPKSWLMIKRILRFGNCFLHGSMMFRKEDYFKVGGYRDLFHVGQDYDLWLRMSNLKKMRNLKDNLYLWRTSNNNISSSKTDTQFKIGALALYDYRYKNNLRLEEDFEVNNFINKLNNEDRKKYNRCLRDLCIRHGNISMAEKYCFNQGIINLMLLKVAKTIVKTIKLIRS